LRTPIPILLIEKEAALLGEQKEASQLSGN
jgi:hypothetical protein